MAAPPTGPRISPREKRDSNIRQHLENFLVELDNRQDMMEQLSDYLQHRSKWEKPRDLLPVDELELRLDLVEKFQTWKRAQLAENANEDDDPAQQKASEWKLNRLAYTALMTMPLSELKLDHETNYEDIDGALGRVGEAVRSLLFAPEEQSSKLHNPRKRSGAQQPTMRKSAKRRVGSRERMEVESGAGSEEDPSHQQSTNRNEKQRRLALDYDEGKCRISGSTKPEVAHIIPYSFNNASANTDRTVKFVGSFVLFGVTLLDSQRICTLGGTDKAWNMISLDRTLHSYWDKGYLGIKYLGTTPIPGQSTSEITLQVVWMPMVKAAGYSYSEYIDLDDERDTTKGFAYTIQSRAVTAPGHKVYKDPGWPIASGDTFIVRRPALEAQLFAEMIKLRWYLGQIAAISAAAGDPDFVFGHDEEFERAVRNYTRTRMQVERETAEEESEYEKRKEAAKSPSDVKQQRPARLPKPPHLSMPGNLGDLTNLPIRGRAGSPSKQGSPTKTPTTLAQANVEQATAAGEQSAQARGRSQNKPLRENEE
ncbi:unnamed protein product [Clonostachys rosea]|uniref:HNH nuclease domain-containing protein n=1 Tax=Bionectria ochroleuca TaxID=29856 RepID=A0ABY6U8U8_BIOOC|nr:unnamed protein product [Clonostachys rosea]